MKKIILAFAIAAVAMAGTATARSAKPSEPVGPSRETIKSIKAGDAAMGEKDYALAISAYSKALETQELKGDNLAAILVNRGIAYLLTQQCPNAIPDFTQALDVATAPIPQALASRGQCLQESGKVAEAVADYKQAASLAPEEASFAGAYCSAAFNAKAFSEAGPACEAYSAFVPNDKQILEATAVAYQNAGNKIKALEFWQKLLALEPGSAVAKQGIAQNS